MLYLTDLYEDALLIQEQFKNNQRLIFMSAQILCLFEFTLKLITDLMI